MKRWSVLVVTGESEGVAVARTVEALDAYDASCAAFMLPGVLKAYAESAVRLDDEADEEALVEAA